MSALQATDDYSAARATAPRVSLADIEAAIEHKQFVNAGAAIAACGFTTPEPLTLLTLCFLTMKNGFTIVGKSAPASPENFDQEKGETFAYEDAVRQAWPLMGFALRDRLTEEAFSGAEPVRETAAG